MGLKHPLDACIHLFLFAEFPPGRPPRCLPAITLSSRPKRSGVEGPCVLARRRENERPVQSATRRHPSPMDSRGDNVTAKLEDSVILSGATASRSEAVAESKDPQPAQIGRRPSGNSPMLALTNSLRQSTSRSVSAPQRLAIWNNCASCSGVKSNSMPVSAGGRVYAAIGPVAESLP